MSLYELHLLIHVVFLRCHFTLIFFDFKHRYLFHVIDFNDECLSMNYICLYMLFF